MTMVYRQHQPNSAPTAPRSWHISDSLRYFIVFSPSSGLYYTRYLHFGFLYLSLTLSLWKKKYKSLCTFFFVFYRHLSFGLKVFPCLFIAVWRMVLLGTSLLCTITIYSFKSRKVLSFFSPPISLTPFSNAVNSEFGRQGRTILSMAILHSHRFIMQMSRTIGLPQSGRPAFINRRVSIS